MTDIWQSLASFSLEDKLLFDETVRMMSIRRDGDGSSTYSAAVWELSDACDIELERGLDCCDSVMVRSVNAVGAIARCGRVISHTRLERVRRVAQSRIGLRDGRFQRVY